MLLPLGKSSVPVQFLGGIQQIVAHVRQLEHFYLNGYSVFSRLTYTEY